MLLLVLLLVLLLALLLLVVLVLAGCVGATDARVGFGNGVVVCVAVSGIRFYF